MATRKVIILGDDALRKKSKVVTEFNEKLWQLLDDMKDTMYQYDGVGLAAVQVGVLKRAVVIDVGEEDGGFIELINPVIIKKSGENIGCEGCLSVPGKSATVKRPATVVVNAQDRFGKSITLTAKEFFARAVCHELDHLDGVLYVDIAELMNEG